MADTETEVIYRVYWGHWEGGYTYYRHDDFHDEASALTAVRLELMDKPDSAEVYKVTTVTTFEKVFDSDQE